MLTYTSDTSMLTGSSSFATVLFTLVAMVVVLALAYYTTRWLGKRINTGSGTGLIKVLDKTMIGQGKLLAVIKIGDKTMLVGVAENSITKLCDIEESDIVLEDNSKKSNVSFHESLKFALKNTMGAKKEDKGKKEN